MKTQFVILLFGALFLVGPKLWGQTVSGTVTDAETGTTLPGVSIAVKGTTTGTITDVNGSYKLSIPSLQDTLIFSFIGYQKKVVPINGRSTIDIALEVRVIQGQTIVVSGYQTVQSEHVTSAIASVSSQAMQSISTATAANPIQSLQGHVPGVTIITNGDPSGGATKVRIRGVTTLNNNNPLYVVDGMPTSKNVMQILSPNAIESINVLKDAASEAIYGSRASNGVIVITTKQGKDGFNIEYNAHVSMAKYTTAPDMLDVQGRARAIWQAAINDGVDPNSVGPYIQYDWTKNPDGTATLNSIDVVDMLSPTYKASNNNWINLTTRNGFIQKQNLIMSYGGDRGSSLLSFTFNNNKSIIRYNKYKEYSVRLNSNYFLTSDKTIKVGENVVVTNGTYNGGGYVSGYNYRPILPVKTTKGNYAGPPTGYFADNLNPLFQLYNHRLDRKKNLYLLGNIYAKVNLTDNLSIKSNFGLNWNNLRQRNILLKYKAGYLFRSFNSLERVDDNYFQWDFATTAQYMLNTNKSTFNFLLGTEAMKIKNLVSSFRVRGFALQDLSYMVVPSASSGSQFVQGTKSGVSLLSYFGKINYSFENKYMASVTARIDGSSVFGTENTYGIFPAFSAAWALGREEFVRDNLPFISRLKLRFSWGKTGNSNIAEPNARFGLFVPSYGSPDILTAPWARGYSYAEYGTAYDIKGKDSGLLPSGYRRIQTGNPALRWETTVGKNFGLDYGFLGGKLSGSFNYFIRRTKNILVNTTNLATLGEGSSAYINGASLKTRGWGLSATYNGHVNKSFEYYISGNIAHFKDKVVKLPASVAATYPGNVQKTILGHSIHSIFGYVTEGLFKTKSEVKNSAKQPGKGLGRLRYKDLNDDGVINSLDQKYLGSTLPTYQFGINLGVNYKNFDINLFWQGVTGVQAIDGRKLLTDFVGLWTGVNYGDRTLHAWSPKNKDSNIPALSLSDLNHEGRMSTYYVANGSYLKLRQIVIGYTFANIPHIKGLRVYLEGENLLIFKAPSFTSPDPENPGQATGTNAVGNAVDRQYTSAPYPRPMKFTIGIQLKF